MCLILIYLLNWKSLILYIFIFSGRDKLEGVGALVEIGAQMLDGDAR